MKTSSWLRWWQTARSGKQISRAARLRRRRPLWLEALEDRVTPSGTPRLVRDINTATQSSDPYDIVAVGSTVYFADNDGNVLGLWRSDGTTAGTTLVRQITTVTNYTQPISYLTNVNGTLFFAANDGVNGRELWKSDGTTAGTVMVKDIFPGTYSQNGQTFPNSSSPGHLTSVNGTLFFTADDGVHGNELWKSDGTAAGTVMVKDINTDIINTNGWSGAQWLTNVNGTLFFSADDAVHGVELWKSDGTAAGTVMVKDINTSAGSYNGSNPNSLANFNGVLFFSADDGTHGFELWESDGTAGGTIMVRDINASSGSYPGALTPVNGTLFFFANDGAHNSELWKSNGTAAGTVMVRDINPGGSSNIVDLTAVNATLFFSADDGTGPKLWKSDGTTAGTMMVANVQPGGSYGSSGYLINVNGTLFFTAYDGSGIGLWKSDGTATGTVLVKDTSPGNANSFLTNFKNANGTVFFAGNSTHGRYLWKSDGTTAGTVIVATSPTTADSNPSFLANLNGTLFFAANDGTHGAELWKSDGTAAGTVMVQDVNSTGLSSNPQSLTNVNGTIFFAATDAEGTELWKSDGTAAGTVLVKDIFPGTYTNYYGTYPNSSAPSNLTNVSGTLFFVANDGVNGRELWESDGTAGGTVLVRDINPGSGDSNPSFLTNLNGTLFFSANDGTHGIELWKSNGTAAGTVMVADINSGSAGSNPGNLTNVNGTLYFSADDGMHGLELWKSDGTAAGTVMVTDINAGSRSANPGNLTNVNGTLYFTASDGTHGAELWKTDGTAAGTALVKDIDVGSAGSSPGDLANLNGTLLFTADDGVHGQEVWKSNGTAAGTVIVSDINSGSGGSNPTGLANINGTLYFAANDGVHGQELWQSDGTATGTVMVADINSGSAGSNPNGFTSINGTLYFAADDGVHGQELWVLPPAPPTVAGLRVNDGSIQRSEVRSLTVTFSGPVNFAGGNANAAAAFQLNHVQTGNNVTLAAAVSTNGQGQTVVTLSFFGTETDPVSAENGGVPSLSDGRYTLTILSADATGTNGQALDGAGTGTPGSNYVSIPDTLGGGPGELGLYRFFGDSDGNGIDDQLDLGQFRSTFNANAGNPAYTAYLDADNSGVVDQTDLGQFRSRFNANVFAPQTPGAAPTPPKVASVEVNDGSAERSEVRSITVTFSGLVSFTGGNANADSAFQLDHLTDSNDVELASAVSTNGQGQTVVTLTFAGAETDPVSSENGGMASLADGRYSLAVLSANVRGANGLALNSGGPNGNYVSPTDTLGGGPDELHLFRLFGDVNGDGVVDQTDLGLFRLSFDAGISSPLYLSYLDADNSGVVDALDLGQFRSRFNANVF